MIQQEKLLQILAELYPNSPLVEALAGQGGQAQLAGGDAEDELRDQIEGDPVQEGQFDPPDDVIRQIMPLLDLQNQGGGSRTPRPPPPPPAGIAPDDWAPIRHPDPPVLPPAPSAEMWRNFLNPTQDDYSSTEFRDPHPPHVNILDEMGPPSPRRGPYRPWSK